MKNGRKNLRQSCGAISRRGLPCQCKLLLKAINEDFMAASQPRLIPEGKARAPLVSFLTIIIQQCHGIADAAEYSKE
jgi:hypothetical protein